MGAKPRQDQPDMDQHWSEDDIARAKLGLAAFPASPTFLA